MNMHYERTERERMREQIRKAWQAMATIRETLEQHVPNGAMPSQEFLADFSDEATILVATLKQTLANRVTVSDRLT